MRRSIGLIALLSVLAASAIRLPAARASAMACCRGGSSMTCCLPGSGCAVRSCPPAGLVDAGLPGLPPAVVETIPAETPLPASGLAAGRADSPRASVILPPRRPPRV